MKRREGISRDQARLRHYFARLEDRTIRLKERDKKKAETQGRTNWKPYTFGREIDYGG